MAFNATPKWSLREVLARLFSPPHRALRSTARILSIKTINQHAPGRR